MAPARSSARRAHGHHDPRHPDVVHHHNVQPQPVVVAPEPVISKDDIFLEPMMGTPQAIYVEKDVDNRDHIVELINKHGGVVSPGYSGVPYILVDPYKESGQNLYRQYAGKKGKIVLSAAWVYECVKAGALQTYMNNWAGFIPTNINVPVSEHAHAPPPAHMAPVVVQNVQPAQIIQQQQETHPHGLPPPITAVATDPLAQHHDPSFTYFQGSMHEPTPPPPWQTASGIAPQQTHMQPAHMIHRQPQPQAHYREEHQWPPAPPAGYHQHPQHPPPPPSADGMVASVPTGHEYRDYREEPPNWVATASEYYQQQYDYSYAPGPDPQYMEAGPSNGQAQSESEDVDGDQRGRKRTRMHPQPAAPAVSLVSNRKNPPARSPTPPTRVIKSTYGGNLFTSDDVLYLKKYIDYCQEQGLVLSLREICERIAVKAPHHTFYSWRRYCNKHQIRLGGYAMDVGDEGDDTGQGGQVPGDQQLAAQPVTSGVSSGTISNAKQAALADMHRTRSPTPPRALFRSTTGKGVAFTDEDVTFLVRFLEYRSRTQGGKVDMVAFWKDVAAKAPHHSRASWMKFYRRHKHELNHEDGDVPLPLPPEKKMRYSKQDDSLLARFFYEKPEGTSDKVFQMFARMHPHHPWKGWQEHHRIHKAKIDYLIEKLGNGETIDSEEET
ncbi:hypothetical protein EIP91_010688 [Steccherinum ochraceum]|uniref:BRCT domain-containing protein n=1 Tax=Steccherinum ochraceum TaxID=92696 RepID=A0A4R0R2H5_9APHY|nr:hypothetical protein EIP91_010688 [Steccherinum ochraceum]